jgi:hypothetical protein
VGIASLVLGALSLLLGLAGVAKLRRPGPATSAFGAAAMPFPSVVVRVLAISEVDAAVAGFVLPVRVGGAVVAGAFACIAGGAVSCRTS